MNPRSHTFALAGLLLAIEALAQDGTGFKQLPGTDCAVWVANPRRQAQHWTGSCRDGKAQGQGALTGVFTADSGRQSTWRFEGTLAQGMSVGFGYMVIDQISEYQGQFRNGTYHGWGSLQLVGGIRYEGQFVRGNFHGLGTLTETDGTVTRGLWLEGQLTGPRERRAMEGSWVAVFGFEASGLTPGVIAGTGETQAGTYRSVEDRFVLQGHGLYLWDKDRLFIGDFQDGLPQGLGALVVPDKAQPSAAAVFSGKYRQGCLWRGDYYTNVLVDGCKR